MLRIPARPHPTLLFIFALLITLTPPVTAYKQSEIDWVGCSNITTKLLWGASVNVSCARENYTFVVRDFSVEGDFVVFDIYHNNTLLTQGFMQGNDTFYYNGTPPLLVVLGGISGGYQEEEPTYSIAGLGIYTPGTPDFSFSTNTSYDSRCVYNTSVSVNNSGTARLKNVVVSYEIPDELYVLRTSADRPYHTGYGGHFRKKIPLSGELDIGESVTTWFEVLPPALSTTQYYLINVSVSGEDILGRDYQKNFTYNISVPRSITVSKSITLRRPYAASSYIGTVRIATLSQSDAGSEKSIEEKVYPGSISQHFQENAVPYVWDQLITSVSVFNTGCNDIEEVRVSEVIPEDFIIDPYEDTSWTVSLKSKSSASFNYTLRPLHTGEYALPSTRVSMLYNGESYQALLDMSGVKLTFHGPDISVNKSVSPEVIRLGETVTVVLSVENLGDRSAYVEVYDALPRGGSIKTGSMRVEGVLHPKSGSDEPRVLSTSYTFKVNREGLIRLPAAKAEFVDITHYNNTAYSNRPVIKVVKDVPAPERSEEVPGAITPPPLPPPGINASGNTSTNTSGGILPVPGFNGWSVALVITLSYFILRKS